MKATTTWRVIGAAALALGLASFILTTVLQWILQAADPSATMIEAIGRNPQVWLTMSLAAVLGPLVWIAGIIPVTALVRGRGWVLTTIGGYATGIGLAAGVGHLALYFGLYGDLAASGLDTSAAATVGSADDRGVLTNLLLMLFLIAFGLGPILLTVGLRRGGLVAVWVPVAAIVATVANFVGGMVAGGVQLAALALTFVPLIVILARPRPARLGLPGEGIPADQDRRAGRAAALGLPDNP
jgi:hypothetical protein